MITGTHAILYAEQPERTRAFFRDVLGLSHVDAHDGWLIFKLPPAELGVHPSRNPQLPDVPISGGHELYLMCDDLAATVDELSAKGVEFVEPVTDQGFGRMTALRVPGAGTIGLYQPLHPTANDLPG
ncbi:extradiol dioxygenase [Amycolatopsis antarctica]|uniref:Extradiol dioxygenase n=1 Tax=Amycolatopsis antarctica TaxID=1854586 RepID=A0A263DAI2_9PSEU|nr:VOC family protein [Amycolatopsis antarctica]OZM75179.1 extradiol dioxygenase [Amycolatopsis antarctica]